MFILCIIIFSLGIFSNDKAISPCFFLMINFRPILSISQLLAFPNHSFSLIPRRSFPSESLNSANNLYGELGALGSGGRIEKILSEFIDTKLMVSWNKVPPNSTTGFFFQSQTNHLNNHAPCTLDFSLQA